MQERGQTQGVWSPGQVFWGSVLAVVLAGFWLMGGMMFSSQPKPSAQPAPTPTAFSPEVVAGSFLSQIKLEYWDAAYDLLSSDRKSRLSAELFRRNVGEFWSVEENRWELRYRQLGAPRLHGSVCRISVRAIRGGGRPWEWELHKDGEEWKIYTLDGAFGLK